MNLTRTAFAIGMVLALSACNQNETAGQHAGSGNGPTEGAGSSNTPTTATNGAPATQ